MYMYVCINERTSKIHTQTCIGTLRERERERALMSLFLLSPPLHYNSHSDTIREWIDNHHVTYTVPLSLSLFLTTLLHQCLMILNIL